ncbi:hypothetical protein AusDCA_0567 [Desulfitobacterium sp. AusDCA]
MNSVVEAVNQLGTVTEAQAVSVSEPTKRSLHLHKWGLLHVANARI